jgi:hypothetical protein
MEVPCSTLVYDFKHAFPDIPLRVLLEAGTWVRLAAAASMTRNLGILMNRFTPRPWEGARRAPRCDAPLRSRGAATSERT